MRCGSTRCKFFRSLSLSYLGESYIFFRLRNIFCRFRRKRFNWPEEMHPFEWESDSESEDGSEEQVSREDITLPDTQTTDGLIPIRLFEIFEVVKCP
jgi:hypothetical protein